MIGFRVGLERECRTFTRYLVGHEPSPYIVAKYCDAHAGSPAFRGDRFDERLVVVARWHPVTALLTDAYARIFDPHGVLRKKLVLVLAILEVSPPFCRELEALPTGGLTAQALRVGARLLVFPPALLLGVIMLLPVRLLTPRGGNRA